MLAALWTLGTGKARSPAEFAPHLKAGDDDEKPADINDVFGVLRAVAKSNTSKKRTSQQGKKNQSPGG